jgi:hypothetical protein
MASLYGPGCKGGEFGKGSGNFEMTVAPGSPLVVSVGVGLQGDEC